MELAQRLGVYNMSTTISIHDLPRRIDEVRQVCSDDEITITDGQTPIARLVPLTGATRRRFTDPFAGDFTDDDIRHAKAVLASNPRFYTTEQVKAVLRALID